MSKSDTRVPTTRQAEILRLCETPTEAPALPLEITVRYVVLRRLVAHGWLERVPRPRKSDRHRQQRSLYQRTEAGNRALLRYTGGRGA